MVVVRLAGVGNGDHSDKGGGRELHFWLKLGFGKFEKLCTSYSCGVTI